MSLGLEKLLLFNGTQKQVEEYWYFSREVVKTNTPSRMRGMSCADEMKIRRSAVRFLKNLSQEVYQNWASRCNGNKATVTSMLSSVTARVHATAAVWFHRFFMVHPLQIFDPHIVAAACLYLASKVEDYPQSIGAIVFYSRQILEQWGIEQEWEEIEDELVDLENCVVKTLGFVIWVKHPHLYIPAYVNQLIGDAGKLGKIQQLALQYASDSLGTTFCIRINPRKLAIVFIAWACQDEQFPLDNWKNKGEKCTLTNWLHSFNIKEESVHELHQEYLKYVEREKQECELLVSSSSSNSSRSSQSFFHPALPSASNPATSSASSSSSSSTSNSSAPSPNSPSPSSSSSSSCDGGSSVGGGSGGSGTPANHRITEFNTKHGQNNNENYHLSAEKRVNGAYNGSSNFLSAAAPEVGPV